MHRRELRHVRQQFDLDFFFRAEVREQPALRHSNLVGQNPECDASEAGLAHQGQPLMKYPFARRCGGIRHGSEKHDRSFFVKRIDRACLQIL